MSGYISRRDGSITLARRVAACKQQDTNPCSTNTATINRHCPLNYASTTLPAIQLFRVCTLLFVCSLIALSLFCVVDVICIQCAYSIYFKARFKVTTIVRLVCVAIMLSLHVYDKNLLFYNPNKKHM